MKTRKSRRYYSRVEVTGDSLTWRLARPQNSGWGRWARWPPAGRNRRLVAAARPPGFLWALPGSPSFHSCPPRLLLPSPSLLPPLGGSALCSAGDERPPSSQVGMMLVSVCSSAAPFLASPPPPSIPARPALVGTGTTRWLLLLRSLSRI
jgi:hypothetical protein